MKMRWKPTGGWKQALLALMAGEAGLAVLTGLCYKAAVWMLPLQLLLVPAYKEYEKWMRRRRRNQYIEGFRELLRSLTTSMQAGFSLENSCRAAYRELEEYYGKGRHPILDRVGEICRGIELNISIEELFYQFARETGLADVYEFASVMETVRITGGNMVEILKSASWHLQVRMDAEDEINVCLSGIRFEKNIMLLMPLIMLVYLNLTGTSYTDAFYETLAGRIIMTLLILILLACYYWTERILKRCSVAV